MSPEDFAIGIDVGGTNMRAARISPSGEILKKRSIAGSRDPAVALGLIKDLVRDMDGDGARAIGIGIPGRVDGWTGEIISGGFLDLSGVDLKQELSNTFGHPTIVANDCSLALIGESRRGAAKGLRNAVMMTIGTGIGGAVIGSYFSNCSMAFPFLYPATADAFDAVPKTFRVVPLVAVSACKSTDQDARKQTKLGQGHPYASIPREAFLDKMWPSGYLPREYPGLRQCP